MKIIIDVLFIICVIGLLLFFVEGTNYINNHDNNFQDFCKKNGFPNSTVVSGVSSPNRFFCMDNESQAKEVIPTNTGFAFVEK